MNRAQMRDWLRRQLGLVPATDVAFPNARPGDGLPHQPHPTNMLLNQAIENAAAKVNRELGLTDAGRLVKVSVPATSQQGPYEISLNELPDIPHERVLDVRRVWWLTGTTYNPLQPVNYQELMRSGYNYMNYGASTPIYYAVEAYRLGIIPAPATMGTVVLAVGTCLFAPMSDHDDFANLPLDFYPAVLYNALVELGKILAEDVEMARRASAFQYDAELGIDAIYKWSQSLNKRHQIKMIPVHSYRC